LFSLLKGRYGGAERDFNPYVASDISLTPQPSAAPLESGAQGQTIFHVILSVAKNLRYKINA